MYKYMYRDPFYQSRVIFARTLGSVQNENRRLKYKNATNTSQSQDNTVFV